MSRHSTLNNRWCFFFSWTRSSPIARNLSRKMLTAIYIYLLHVFPTLPWFLRNPNSRLGYCNWVSIFTQTTFITTGNVRVSLRLHTSDLVVLFFSWICWSSGCQAELISWAGRHCVWCTSCGSRITPWLLRDLEANWDTQPNALKKP